MKSRQEHDNGYGNARYSNDGYGNGTYSADAASQRQTGLLTRFVPNALKNSAIYRWFLRFTRLLQFLSSAISLGMFSSRVYKVYRLVNRFKVSRGINSSVGAVEGILAAAVVYTLLAILMTCLLRGGGPAWLRWLWVLLDLAFVGAFIAVAVLTRPNGGAAGPRHYRNGNGTWFSSGLPWGTFILAIVST